LKNISIKKVRNIDCSKEKIITCWGIIKKFGFEKPYLTINDMSALDNEFFLNTKEYNIIVLDKDDLVKVIQL
jgi:hypothetical protein